MGAKVTEYLLEKSRIVTQAPEERNYHVFYELLAGLAEEEKLKYGLLSADKYFYLNQGGNCEIDGKYDGEDFQSLMSAMQVLGFTSEEQDTIFRILASGTLFNTPRSRVDVVIASTHLYRIVSVPDGFHFFVHLIKRI